jgi:hypothetical protein
MYVSEVEIKSCLKSESIDQLAIDTAATRINKITESISFAENYVRNRLSQTHQIDSELSKNGDSRIAIIKNIIISIALHNLKGFMPEIEVNSKDIYFYTQAEYMLKSIANGSLAVTGLTQAENQAPVCAFGVSNEVIY